VAQKLYLAITVDNDLSLEALVDTGADITLMSAQLFERLSAKAKSQDLTLTVHPKHVS